MRDTFVKTLVDLAKEDKNIELVTGDLGFGVLKPFSHRYMKDLVSHKLRHK